MIKVKKTKISEFNSSKEYVFIVNGLVIANLNQRKDWVKGKSSSRLRTKQAILRDIIWNAANISVVVGRTVTTGRSSSYKTTNFDLYNSFSMRGNYTAKEVEVILNGLKYEM